MTLDAQALPATTLLAHLATPVWLLHPDGTLHAASPATARWIAPHPSRPFWAWPWPLPSIIRDRLRHAVEQVAQGRTPPPLRLPLHAPLTLTPLGQEDGQPSGILVEGHAPAAPPPPWEQRLVELEAIYQTTPIGLCFFDHELRYVSINQYLAQSNNLPVAEHLGRTLREVKPLLADLTEPYLRQVLEREEPLLNLELMDPTGAEETVWLCDYHPVRHADGSLWGVHAVVQDITSRRRTENALRAADQEKSALLAQLEALLANAPIGFAFFDKAGRYLRINEPLAAMNGLSVEAHLGQRITELLPGVAGMAWEAIQQVFRTSRALYNLEIMGVTPAAPHQPRHWLTSFYPVMGEEGPLVVGAIVVQITEQKEAEAALRASEDRFRSTFENAAVGIAHVAPDG